MRDVFYFSEPIRNVRVTRAIVSAAEASQLGKLNQLSSQIGVRTNFASISLLNGRSQSIAFGGSNDRVEWKKYSFRSKPGALNCRPPFVAPHQPRLDWQMWFAALGDARSNPWFVNFCVRLLQGSPEVLSLNKIRFHPRRQNTFALASTITNSRPAKNARAAAIGGSANSKANTFRRSHST